MRDYRGREVGQTSAFQRENPGRMSGVGPPTPGFASRVAGSIPVRSTMEALTRYAFGGAGFLLRSADRAIVTSNVTNDRAADAYATEGSPGRPAARACTG